jgi:dUTPase
MLTTEAPLSLKAGDRFAQGILVPYVIANNDHILMKQRVSGFGSTGGI